jgi:ABC-type amino acid transport substrate-binding protein
MKKKYLFITFFILASTIFFLKKYLFNNEKKKPIVVGMMNGWAPYMVINEKGIMEGFDVDIVKEIEKITKEEIIIKDLGSLSSLFIALGQGSVDAIFSGLDVTQKRKNAYNYVLYGGEETKITQCIVISSLNGPKNEDDLKKNNYKIALEAGTSWEATLDQYSSLERIYTTSIADMVLQLEQNRIDCFVLESTQANRLIKKIKNLNYFTIDLDPSVQIDGIGIFINKNNTQLKNNFEQAIEELKNNHTMNLILQKWQLK